MTCQLKLLLQDQPEDDLGYRVESNIDQMLHDSVFFTVETGLNKPSCKIFPNNTWFYLTYLAARLLPNSNTSRPAGTTVDSDMTSPVAENLNLKYMTASNQVDIPSNNT